MHIVFLTNEYPKEGETQGGIGSVVQTIARSLVKKGEKVSVVGWGSVKKTNMEVDNGVSVHRFPESNWKFARFIQNVMRRNALLKKLDVDSRIDIIEGSELNFAFIPSLYAKNIIRMHGGHHFFSSTLGKKAKLWRSFQEKRSFKNSDAYIAVSDFVGNTTTDLLKLKKSFSTIYNIIDTNKFFPADPNKIIKNKIVFVGTVIEKKGVRQLVMAMKDILKKYPDATLDIIGRDWVNPDTGESYTKYLTTFITEDIKESIDIVGPLPHDEIPYRLESAEVCVYPSHMEAMPIAWLEALGMEKAVVASSFGPGPEAVIDKVSGLLCNPLEPIDIAEKINYMFSHPKEAIEMGKKARKDILERFDPDSIVSQNIEFYKAQL